MSPGFPGERALARSAGERTLMFMLRRGLRIAPLVAGECIIPGVVQGYEHRHQAWKGTGAVRFLERGWIYLAFARGVARFVGPRRSTQGEMLRRLLYESDQMAACLLGGGSWF